jgi:ATP-dependent RNA helicase DOB1
LDSVLTKRAELQELEIERSNTIITDEATVRDYYNLRQQLDTHTKDMRDVIMHPNYCLQFLQAGRLVKIKFKDYDFGWGAVVSFQVRRANKGEVLQPQQSYVVDVLLSVAADTRFMPQVSEGLPPGVRPPPPGEKGKMEVVPVVLNCIESIGHLRVFLPNELKSTEQKNSVRKALDEVKKRFPDGIAILDPIENMNIKDDSFKRLLRVRTRRQPSEKWLTCVENRSTRIPPAFKPVAQFAEAPRTVQPVCGQDGACRQDQEYQEGHCERLVCSAVG